MTLYNCTICKSVHDSSSPVQCSGTHVTVGFIGDRHPDLVALAELRDVTLDWLRNEARVARLASRTGPGMSEADRELYFELCARSGELFDEMVRRARRWEPLEGLR